MRFKRIAINPRRMNGQPCIRNLRLTVRRVVEAVALYPDRRELKREYPELEEEDIREAPAYAAANLDDKVPAVNEKLRRTMKRVRESFRCRRNPTCRGRAHSESTFYWAADWEISLVAGLDSKQIKGVKATVAELHRDTQRLVKPVVNGHETLVITDQGEARAKLVPLPTKANRKKALAILRSIRGLELPLRK